MRPNGVFSTKLIPLSPSIALKNSILVAPIAIAIATLMRALLDPLLKSHGPYLLFAIAVMVAALYGGKWAGFGAILLSIPVCDYLFIEPRYTWFIHDAQADSIMLALFGSLGVFTTVIIDRFHENRTRLRQSLLDLQRTELKLEMIDANVPEAIFTASTAGLAEHLNGFFSRYSGCELPAIMGSGWLQLIHPDDRDAFLSKLSSPNGGTDQFEDVLRLRRFDGTYRAFKCHATEKKNPTTGTATWFGVCSDIEHEKVLSAALEKRTQELITINESLERFAYTASHDLQEPLRTIGAMTELFLDRKRGELDVESSEILGAVIAAVDRMKRLVRDIMELAKTANAALATTSEVDMRAIAESAIANLLKAIQESGAKVSVGDLPVICANESAMLRVVQNILANAIKFRANRPLEIHISAAHHDGEYVFSIRDNGIGIDPQYRERIFEPFRRLHGRSEYEGSGLGLAACRRIIRAMGGRIWVESKPGEGSTFSFTVAENPGGDNHRPGTPLSGPKLAGSWADGISPSPTFGTAPSSPV